LTALASADAGRARRARSDAASAIQQSLGALGTAASDLKTAAADDENC